MHGVWLGTSIENDRFAYRADALRSLPRHPNGRRFVSAEPLLGPLVHRCETCGGAGGTWSAAGADPCEAHCNQGWHGLDLTGIDWLIIGGESGPHARPMDPQWVRDLIVKARAAGTAVFVKQMGGLRPGGPIPDEFDIREYPR
jgi:protein gp37